MRSRRSRTAHRDNHIQERGDARLSQLRFGTGRPQSHTLVRRAATLVAAVLTAIFLGIAALLATGGSASRRPRALAMSLVIWFGALILHDVVAV